MKRIDDMTREEIVALTDEQVNMLIDYDCAMEGKPLLPPCPVEPKKVDFEPDVTAYKVAGLYTTCPEYAARILEAVESGTQYKAEYTSGSYNRLAPVGVNDYNRVKIEATKVYSPEHWDEIKNSANQYETAKKQYGEAKKEYDEAVSERAEISDRIWDWVGEARNEEYRRTRIRNEYSRYLELSEGNKSIAMNFLKKAHNVPADLEEELSPPIEAVAS